MLVVTGYPFEMGQKTEIIDLINPDTNVTNGTNITSVSQNSIVCQKLADTPGRYGAVGGLIQNKAVIVGGEHDYR